MIDETLFSPDAPMNVGRRFTHDCTNKSDKRLIITRIPQGWKYYCHGCHEKGVRFTRELSPSEWKAWQSASTQVVQEHTSVYKVELPHGFTRDIPAIGLAWLYKYDLSDEEIGYYGFGYSPRLNRVILPVYRGNDLVYWQGRNLGEVTDRNPKYMNVKALGRRDIYFEAPGIPERLTNACVVVEDIISSVKVGRQLDCFGLLYAYVPDDLIRQLSSAYEKVILWLDPDKFMRMMKQVTRYRTLGMNVVMVQSNHDPKFYTDDEISEKLEV